MPDDSYLASSVDAARQVKQYLRLVEARDFAKLLETIDDDAIAAGQGRPGFAHPGAAVLVLCQVLVGVQKRLGRSAIPLIESYLTYLETGTTSKPEIWVPPN